MAVDGRIKGERDRVRKKAQISKQSQSRCWIVCLVMERKRLGENSFEKRRSSKWNALYSIRPLIPGMKCSIKEPRMRGSECRHDRRDARREAGTIYLDAHKRQLLAGNRKSESEAARERARTREEEVEEATGKEGATRKEMRLPATAARMTSLRLQRVICLIR